MLTTEKKKLESVDRSVVLNQTTLKKKNLESKDELTVEKSAIENMYSMRTGIDYYFIHCFFIE